MPLMANAELNILVDSTKNDLTDRTSEPRLEVVRPKCRLRRASDKERNASSNASSSTK
ncbi:MAG: hypothetical protein WCY19_06125 [Candidatus Gastranaerophilaceae bacterium]